MMGLLALDIFRTRLGFLRIGSIILRDNSSNRETVIAIATIECPTRNVILHGE